MTTRRDFLKKATVIPVAGMLPGSVVSPGSPRRNARAETDMQRLRRLCLDRLSDRYDKALFLLAAERLDHELAILDRIGRADEFLAVAELVEFAREEGIPLRLTASGCSSIIPYLLEFSDVDPIQRHLYFERFRDPKGRWAPPFVIQVDGEHQERIARIASLGYGRDFVEKSVHFTSTMTREKIPVLVAEALQREHGCTVDLSRIPLDDDHTFRLTLEDIAATETLHSLSVERGDLMERYLQRAGEAQFPGSDNPAILEALSETRGLILYQEQIMKLLDRIGGICPADGFDFIKAVFKRKAATVAEYRAKFLRTAVGGKMDRETSERLFDQITEAAGYSVCKANSVAMAMTIYQAAYLKAHYRPEFDKVVGKVRPRN